MSVRIVELIETTLEKRGKGTGDDPVRRVTQYWTRDGQLLFEIDPLQSPQGAEIDATVDPV